MRLRVVAVLLPLALLAAGCGRSTGPAKPDSTAKCLKTRGFQDVSTADSKIGLIAGTAEFGGLYAVTADGNKLVIAFAADGASARGTRAAFAKFAPPSYRHHLSDILYVKRNAVLKWTTSPTAQQLQDAENCLG